MSLVVWGLILDIIGVSVLTLTSIANPRYQKIYGQPLRKTYWWNGWRPFYKDTKVLKWKIKWNHKPVVFGMVPPRHKLNFLGFLFILIGFILQLIFYSG